MTSQSLRIKVSFITGLKDIVRTELEQYPDLYLVGQTRNPEYGDFLYLNFVKNFQKLTSLKSVLRAYVATQSTKYAPPYINNHKSILGNIIELILDNSKEQFKTFKLITAGRDTPTIRSIAAYINSTYGLSEESEEADMKIHIIKINETWEISIEITPRPLSIRDYRERHMRGAMDPTIAYAMNSLAVPENASSYLNPFSGGATLLIEAAKKFPNLEKLVGFDNSKQALSIAMQNIKKAGLIKKIRLYEKDIFNKPNLGQFDIITSNLPFGMAISKGEDLEKLYDAFIEYAQSSLNSNGRLVIYTSEESLLRGSISRSRLEIIDTLELKIPTSTKTILCTYIFLCRLV